MIYPPHTLTPSHTHIHTPHTHTLDMARFPRHTFSEEFQQKPTKAGAAPPSPQLPLLLTSEENMFVEMRDLNFASVGHFLSKEAKKITEAYNVRACVGV